MNSSEQHKYTHQELSDKIKLGFKLAFEKLVKKAKENDDYLLFTDKDGNVIKVPAKDL